MNKSVRKRMEEFALYHKYGDGECNTIALKRLSDKRGLDFQQRYEIAYLFSITYSVMSATVLFDELEFIREDIIGWSEKNKHKIVFQSDRKYIRMKDNFEKCLMFFLKNISDGKDFVKKVSDGKTIILQKAIDYVENWTMFGRFSAFLFLEMFVNLTGIPVENTTIDWKNGNTATSGLLNLFGLDDIADGFDKTGKLPKKMTQSEMDKMLSIVLENIRNIGASENITEVETSLCAYRKFYKGSRYNGYYLDRMQEEIIKMSGSYPMLADEFYEIRKSCFDHKYLGELNGWNGIRKNMKKLYKETGMIS